MHLKILSAKWQPSCPGGDELTSLGLRLEYSRITPGQYQCYIMPAGALALTLPCHQQPWYWLCRINPSLSSMRKDFNHLCHFSVEEWLKMQIHFRADSSFAPSQWETVLQSNAVSHWLVASLESALHFIFFQCSSACIECWFMCIWCPSIPHLQPFPVYIWEMSSCQK